MTTQYPWRDGAGSRCVTPVVGALPLIIVFFIFQKQFVQGISLAGSKG